MLEITDEAELDQFIGGLIKRAGRAVGQFARSGAGRAFGGILKGAAKKALPIVGGAIGGYVGGPAGSRVGSQLAAKAGSLFGLELEGLSEEDQEFEVARRVVRFADAAAKNLASAPSSADPQQAANGCGDCGRQAPRSWNDPRRRAFRRWLFRGLPKLRQDWRRPRTPKAQAERPLDTPRPPHHHR